MIDQHTNIPPRFSMFAPLFSRRNVQTSVGKHRLSVQNVWQREKLVAEWNETAQLIRTRMFQVFGGGISMIVTLAVLFYVSWRFLAAMRERRKIMAEMREVSSSVMYTRLALDASNATDTSVSQVQQARENIEYIRDQIARALEEIKVDVAQELRITDRLTSESSKVSAALQRFLEVEANLIELVRMDRNMESVRVETPEDVHEEIRRIVTMVENRRREDQERSLDGMGRTGAATGTRNPISKFSACGPRDPAFDRPRILTTPEVRLLGDSTRSEANK